MFNLDNFILNPKYRSGMSNAEKHLQEHGSSPCNLLQEFDEPLGIEALCNLHNEFKTPFPQQGDIETALRDIEGVLARQTPAWLDRLGRDRSFYAADATHWHGARISELRRSLKHAR